MVEWQLLSYHQCLKIPPLKIMDGYAPKIGL
jgi:hypothetical protein